MACFLAMWHKEISMVKKNFFDVFDSCSLIGSCVAMHAASMVTSETLYRKFAASLLPGKRRPLSCQLPLSNSLHEWLMLHAR